MAERPHRAPLDAARFPEDRRARRRRGIGSIATPRPPRVVPRPRGSSPSRRRTASPPSSTASTSWPPRRSSSRRRGSRRPDFVVPGGGAKVVQALAAGQVAVRPRRLEPSAQDHREGQGRPHDLRHRHALLLRQHRGAQGAVRQGRQERRGARRREAGRPQGRDRRDRHRLRHLRVRRVRAEEHARRPTASRSTTTSSGWAAARRPRCSAASRRASSTRSWPCRSGSRRRSRRASAGPSTTSPDEKAWNRVFGGPIPVTVGYVLKETIEKSPDLVQGYVNACYRAQQWIRTRQGRRDRRPPLEALHGQLQARGRARVGALLQDHLRLGLRRSRRRTTSAA